MVDNDNSSWDTSIEVGERIVDLLSGRIYRSLQISIKEMISNAWDADADNVRVSIDVERKAILISDDGSGMTKDELKRYPSIAISKKPKRKKTKKGRPYIGNFGIGVFSALPFCRKILVETEIEDSDQVNILEIETKTWMDKEGRLRPPTDNKLETKFPGYTFHDSRRIKDHGTTITLEDIFSDHWDHLFKGGDTPDISYSGIEKLKRYLCQTTPIEYHPEAHPYSDFFLSSTEYSPMNLFFNGEKLFRNNISRSDGSSPRILEKNEHCEIANGAVVVKYLIVSPLENVDPEEMRGLQKRMQNVAIGEPEHFDIYRRSPKLYGRMKYITGEIHILKGLENQLSLDRETVLPCPEYTEMSLFFRDKLCELANELEDFAIAEKSIGALAYLEGVPLEVANYGFLAEGAVRSSTKKKHALEVKSKRELEEKLNKQLKKLKYEVRKVKPNESSDKITVNHEEKIVTIVDSNDEKSVFSFEGKVYYEAEELIVDGKIAKMEGDKISFNYNHPVFKTDFNIQSLKQIISVMYLLNREGKVSDEAIDSLNKMLMEIF